MFRDNLRHYMAHYFAPRSSHQLRELFFSSAVLDFAVASVMIFEPIYLYTLGFTLQKILLFYLALYIIYFFMLPFGGRICRARGFEHAMFYSSFFLILYYVALFGISITRWCIPVAIVALAIQKTLYWTGFHANFAVHTDNVGEGREVSNRVAISAFVQSIAPAFGGIVLGVVGFPGLFVAVSVLVFASNFILLKVPETFAVEDFSYRAALVRPFEKKRRRVLFSFFGFGEELIALVLWPIFMLLIIPNYFSLGVIISFAMIVNVFVTLYIGRACDEGSRGAVLRSGAVFTSLSWIIRPLAAGGMGVFLMDSFYRVSRNMVGIPLIASVYEHGRAGSVTETAVFFEMALSIGKIIAALLCLVALALFASPWPAIFFIAAAFTLLYSIQKTKS